MLVSRRRHRHYCCHSHLTKITISIAVSTLTQPSAIHSGLLSSSLLSRRLFLTEGWGMCQPNDFLFNLRDFTFWFDTEKALFQVILGLL